MTTKEVAEYLRVKERKIYELLRQGDIPCTRVTGKWLFPKPLIDQWLAGVTDGPEIQRREPPPPIVAGSADPLLEWALQESGSELAMLGGGSTAGLEHVLAGRAVAAGIHLLDGETGEYNVMAVESALGSEDVVLLEWAWRRQGFIVALGNPLGIKGPKDLVTSGARVALRQDGSGSRLLFDTVLRGAEIAADDLRRVPDVAKNEMDLALTILDGKADVGVAVEAAARQLRLEFLPLATERYDIVVRRREYFEPSFQKLLALVSSDKFRARATELGGYEIRNPGKVVYNSP